MPEEIWRISQPEDPAEPGQTAKSEQTVETGQAAEPTDTGRSDLAGAITSAMSLSSRDWSQSPPLPLAWIGDTVYDLIVRSILLQRGMTQPDKLHKKAAKIVNARAQASLMRQIREKLTVQEQAVCRRGRNAKPGHKAKNADMEEYLEATAFECLTGYLYLTGRYGRLMELIGPEMEKQEDGHGI